MQTEPLILDVKGNSLDDGPGIRTVVFFKGCPLSCVWCHNPESKKAYPEISFDASECAGCDTCLKTCARGALSRKNPFFIDRNRCDLCFQCVETCPSGALSTVGRQMGVDDILAEIRKDKPFFLNSGGGVTLSGGEPTLHMDFLSMLLKALKAEGIHTLLETCGLFQLDRFEKKILPFIDTIFYDIKLMDPDEHRRFCGVGNEGILKNFVRLNERSKTASFSINPRTPLIPEITATDRNLTAIADFLIKNGVHEAALLPYNPLWHDKNAKIGVTSHAHDNRKEKSWMPREQILQYKKIFEDRRIMIG